MFRTTELWALHFELKKNEIVMLPEHTVFTMNYPCFFRLLQFLYIGTEHSKHGKNVQFHKQKLYEWEKASKMLRDAISQASKASETADRHTINGWTSTN